MRCGRIARRNPKGELEYSVIDLNQDSVVDLAGTDRITRTLRDITTYAGVKVQRTRIYVHRTDGSSTTSVVAMTQTSTNGLSWQTAYKDQSTPVTTASVRTVPDATGNYTVTVTYPDNASQVSAYSYGRLTSVTRKDSGGGQVSQTSYLYDAHGRTAQVIDARNGTTTYTYNQADQPLTESHSGGTMSSLAMNWSYDNALRRDVLTAKYGTNVLQAADYDYDTAGRLGKVKDGSQEAVYGYHPNSTLIATVALTNGPGTGAGLGVSRAYDRLNRLLSISSRAYGAAATNLPVSVGYQYNAANQRTRATLGDGTYWVYQYDVLGQVVAGRRYWADGTEVAGQQFEYRFDDIGNRDTTGGRASAVSDYTANRLNQYNTRTVPLSVDVQGLANPTANVTVNGNVATRQGEYFHHALSVPNATAQYPTITVTSQYGGQQSQSGEVFVPAVTESFGYDADGNLTSDGPWTYFWDGENRLVEMKRDTSTPTLSSRLRTYVRGSDLSGTIEGAGGVGGLLWVNNHQATYDGQTLPTGVHFVAYDGNGNVLALTRASDGSVSARYEYGPFGEPVRVTGALVAAQPFRFSTKWTDAETGLLYYGYRYYNPATGRWPNRDPIAEQGGHNLYGSVYNDPLSRIDTNGREIGSICPKCGQYYVGVHICPPSPQPGREGTKTKRPFGGTYLLPYCCKSKKDQLSPIPGVSTPADKPMPGFGPGAGTHVVYPFPTTPPSYVGSAGAGPCIVLVVKCPGFVAVFHVTGGDSPGGTLGGFSWPLGCSSIICGLDDDPDTNCRRKDVKSAANAAGLNVVGVSGNAGCGVAPDGSWWQWGH